MGTDVESQKPRKRSNSLPASIRKTTNNMQRTLSGDVATERRFRSDTTDFIQQIKRGTQFEQAFQKSVERTRVHKEALQEASAQYKAGTLSKTAFESAVENYHYSLTQTRKTYDDATRAMEVTTAFAKWYSTEKEYFGKRVKHGEQRKLSERLRTNLRDSQESLGELGKSIRDYQTLSDKRFGLITDILNDEVAARSLYGVNELLTRPSNKLEQRAQQTATKAKHIFPQLKQNVEAMSISRRTVTQSLRELGNCVELNKLPMTEQKRMIATYDALPRVFHIHNTSLNNFRDNLRRIEPYHLKPKELVEFNRMEKILIAAEQQMFVEDKERMDRKPLLVLKGELLSDWEQRKQKFLAQHPEQAPSAAQPSPLARGRSASVSLGDAPVYQPVPNKDKSTGSSWWQGSFLQKTLQRAWDSFLDVATPYATFLDPKVKQNSEIIDRSKSLSQLTMMQSLLETSKKELEKLQDNFAHKTDTKQWEFPQQRRLDSAKEVWAPIKTIYHDKASLKRLPANQQTYVNDMRQAYENLHTMHETLRKLTAQYNKLPVAANEKSAPSSGSQLAAASSLYKAPITAGKAATAAATTAATPPNRTVSVAKPALALMAAGMKQAAKQAPPQPPEAPHRHTIAASAA